MLICFVLKLIDFVLRLIDFVLRLIDFVRRAAYRKHGRDGDVAQGTGCIVSEQREAEPFAVCVPAKEISVRGRV